MGALFVSREIGLQRPEWRRANSVGHGDLTGIALLSVWSGHGRPLDGPGRRRASAVQVQRHRARGRLRAGGGYGLLPHLGPGAEAVVAGGPEGGVRGWIVSLQFNDE